MIRRRLQREGVDLNSQVRNQQLAYSSSLTGELATVDFSSASDSISARVVEALLPFDWYQVLTATRSTFGVQKAFATKWEKFSSMGNGFTFELESLIFYAAACAVCDFLKIEADNISVYGDDVIIPVKAYELFASFTAFLGFRVNPSKSFSTTNFRESCGSHYFDGVDCKPLYLKDKLSNVQSVYKLANGIRNLAHRRNSYCGCDSRFLVVWRRLFSRVPKPIRFSIPGGLGDSGFIVNFDEATPSLAGNGFEGYLVPALVESGESQEFEGTGLLLASVRGLSTRRGIIPAETRNSRRSRCFYLDQLLFPSSPIAHGNSYTIRGLTKLRVSRILVPRWYNMGAWG